MAILSLDRPSPIEFTTHAEATPGEKKVLSALHDWAKGHQPEILNQASAAFELPKSQLIISLSFDWSRVPPDLRARAEGAATCKLTPFVHPEERPDGEFKLSIRSKDGAHDAVVWEGSVTDISIRHPELIPAQFGTLQADVGFGMMKRLNEWSAINLDNASKDIFRMLREQKFPIFAAIASADFASSYWTEAEQKACYRISSDFELTADREGRRCVKLTRPNSILDPTFLPNLDKRVIVDGRSYLLVEFLSPPTAAISSPDHFEKFINIVFQQCSRGKAPSELKDEIRKYGSDAAQANPVVLSSEHLARMGLKAPDAYASESSKPEDKGSIVGQEKAKIEASRALRSLVQTVTDDSTLEDQVKTAARNLITPMISSVKHGQKPDGRSFERLGELLPGGYAAEVERLRASLS